MELTVLGSSGSWPGPGRAAAGYLLREAGYNLVLDFGTGVLANLQRHLRHEEIDAIVITHQHLDHCADVLPLFIARLFHPEPLEPLPIVSPPGVVQRLACLENESGRHQLRSSFDVREVEPGGRVALGPFNISTRLLPHWVVNIGLRVETQHGILAYTGDTGPSEELVALARGADLLIAEATWLDGQDEGVDPYHLTARQAAALAAEAEVRRLLLSHFWPTNDREISRLQAREAFARPLVLAEEGLTLEVVA
jgi:ribonuclease BN (tRNA processing enzyme)